MVYIEITKHDVLYLDEVKTETESLKGCLKQNLPGQLAAGIKNYASLHAWSNGLLSGHKRVHLIVTRELSVVWMGKHLIVLHDFDDLFAQPEKKNYNVKRTIRNIWRKSENNQMTYSWSSGSLEWTML